MDRETSSQDNQGNMAGNATGIVLDLADRPGVMSFAGGLPAGCLLPSTAMAEAAALLFANEHKAIQAMQYAAVEGYLPLQQWLVAHMSGLGVPCSVDNIVITSGSQQALDLLGRLFLGHERQGQGVITPLPTYVGAIQAFEPHAPRYIPFDGHALDLDRDLDGIVPGLCYAVPDHSNPTGNSLDEASRIRLLRMARATSIPLVEDAAYSALSFTDTVPRSCSALDIMECGDIESSCVVYCGTFSKVVAPGLRVGWICAARRIAERVVLAKQTADLQASSLSQMLVHHLVSTGGGYQGMADRAVLSYRRRRDAMLSALHSHMPHNVSWNTPQGGMFVWVTLPDGMNSHVLLKQAIGEEGISFVPGPAFHPCGGGANTLRLSYSLQDEDRIAEGMRRLGRLVAREVSLGRHT